MAIRHTAMILAAATAIASPALADTQTARCAEEARQFAATVWHLDPRLKVPLYGAIGLLVGRPLLFAVIGANAESPRERQMIREYEAYCLSDYAGDPPRAGRVILELF